MLSILNPPRIKRVCQQRRLTRYIADYAGRFLLASFLVMPPTIWFVRTCPGDALSYRAGVLSWRPRLRPFRYLHRLWIFEIHHRDSVSDRSNPRIFLPAGLILAALVMLVMGFVPWATSSIMIMFVLLFLCGWFQGMGWPPCGRTMVHWWSQKERGGIVSVWNCAHNVGGGIPPLLFLLGMAWFNDWHAALYMPAFGAILLAIFAFAMMRDTRSPAVCRRLKNIKTTTRTITAKSTKKS